MNGRRSTRLEYASILVGLTTRESTVAKEFVNSKLLKRFPNSTSNLNQQSRWNKCRCTTLIHVTTQWHFYTGPIRTAWQAVELSMRRTYWCTHGSIFWKFPKISHPQYNSVGHHWTLTQPITLNRHDHSFFTRINRFDSNRFVRTHGDIVMGHVLFKVSTPRILGVNRYFSDTNGVNINCSIKNSIIAKAWLRGHPVQQVNTFDGINNTGLLSTCRTCLLVYSFTLIGTSPHIMSVINYRWRW